MMLVSEGCVKSIETSFLNWIPLETALVSGDEAKAEAAMRSRAVLG